MPDTTPDTRPQGDHGAKGRDKLAAKIEETKSSAGAAVDKAAERAFETASDAASSARDAAEKHAETARATAAEELTRTASALERAADGMDDGSGAMQRDLLREAAAGLTQVSKSIENKSVGQIAGELSDFGRENPAAFLGAAALAGFAIGRFVRSSAEGAASDRYGSAAPEGAPYGVARPSPPEPAVSPKQTVAGGSHAR